MSKLSDAQRLFQIRKTMSEMLVARGYLVSQQEQNETFEDFVDTFGVEPQRGAPQLRLHKKANSQEQILILLPQESKAGMKHIQALWEQCKTAGINHAIMVVRSPITTIMRRVIHEMKEIVIELFKEDELLVNITKHVLVPLHQILSNDEKQLLLDRYKLKEHQLPRIQCDDPVARFYGAVPGQVIKITRRSESAGRYIIYRLVI